MHISQDSPLPSDSSQPQVPPLTEDVALPSKEAKKATDPVSIGVLAVLLLLIVGVSLANWLPTLGPTQEKAQAAFENKVGTESGGEIKVTVFTKTNGQRGKLAGVDIYNMDFTAELRFLNEGVWYTRDSLNPEMVSFRFAKGQRIGGDTLANFQNSIAGGKQIGWIGVETVTGTMLGEKTENGWKFKLISCRVAQ